MRKPSSYIAILSPLTLISQIIITNSVDNKPILLIVSYSGFHPDYFNQNLTPFMNKLRHEGTSVDFIQSVFPTDTFPNHHSIATGLYPGIHGVLSKSLYDHQFQRNLTNEPDLFEYNPNIRPLWILNELAGGHSGCMMWPGTSFSYYNRSCTFEIPCNANRTLSWNVRVDTVMSWLTHRETPANLVFLFIEEPDQISHRYSTHSKRFRSTVSRLDDLTGYIHDQLNAANLTDRVNIVHLSDHGMANVVASNFIDITQWLINGTYTIYQSSPVLQIIPTDNSDGQDIVERLKIGAEENGHFQVYTEENIPERWHLENNQRIGPIILVADLDYAFQDQNTKVKMYYDTLDIPISANTEYGLHGYDNNEPLMQAMFLAKGPMIQSYNQIGPMKVIDLYNLFCRILNLKPDPNNGTMSLVDLIIVDPTTISHTTTIYSIEVLTQPAEVSADETSKLSVEATIGISLGVSALAIGIIATVVFLIYRSRYRQFFSKGLRRTNTELSIVSHET